MDDHGASVPDLVDAYLNDKNKLKTLEMKKEIGFDFDGMRRMVKGMALALIIVSMLVWLSLKERNINTEKWNPSQSFTPET